MKHINKTTETRREWFASVPGTPLMMSIFAVGIPFFIFMIAYSLSTDQGIAIPWFSMWIVACIWAIISVAKQNLCYITLCQEQLVYILPFKKLTMDYAKCSVGMDYSLLRGRKIWWIYLCYGKAPVFDPKKPRKRINSLRCKEGFIRIMLSDHVYHALLAVLPKKQKTLLISARRFAGL